MINKYTERSRRYKKERDDIRKMNDNEKLKYFNDKYSNNKIRKESVSGYGL